MTDPLTTNAGPFPTMGDVDRDRLVSRGGGPRETRFSGAGRKGLSIDPSRRGSGRESLPPTRLIPVSIVSRRRRKIQTQIRLIPSHWYSR